MIPINQGLINATWKVSSHGHSYILQKINQNVFSRPEDISFNISSIASYLEVQHPEYYFIAPLKTSTGLSYFKDENNAFYRAFSFVEDSYSRNVVGSADEAFEAASQFAAFSAVLNEFDSSQLRITIPGFHDLSLRYKQLLLALEKGNKQRIH
jgi:hypothetical protein